MNHPPDNLLSHLNRLPMYVLLTLIPYLDNETIAQISANVRKDLYQRRQRSQQQPFLSLILFTNFAKKYLMGADRSTYFSFTSTLAFKEYQNAIIGEISQQRCHKYFTISDKLQQLYQRMQKELEGLQTNYQITQTLKDTLTDPGLPFPRLRREGVGIHSTTSLQLGLVGLQFATKQDNFYQDCILDLEAYLECLEDQIIENAAEKILNESKDSNVPWSTLQKIQTCYYHPEQLSISNYSMFLIQKNQIHNIFVMVHTLLATTAEIYQKYIQDQIGDFQKFVEFIVRFSLYRSSIVAMAQLGISDVIYQSMENMMEGVYAKIKFLPCFKERSNNIAQEISAAQEYQSEEVIIQSEETERSKSSKKSQTKSNESLGMENKGRPQVEDSLGDEKLQLQEIPNIFKKKNSYMTFSHPFIQYQKKGASGGEFHEIQRQGQNIEKQGSQEENIFDMLGPNLKMQRGRSENISSSYEAEKFVNKSAHIDRFIEQKNIKREQKLSVNNLFTTFQSTNLQGIEQRIQDQKSYPSIVAEQYKQKLQKSTQKQNQSKTSKTKQKIEGKLYTAGCKIWQNNLLTSEITGRSHQKPNQMSHEEVNLKMYLKIYHKLLSNNLQTKIDSKIREQFDYSSFRNDSNHSSALKEANSFISEEITNIFGPSSVQQELDVKSFSQIAETTVILGQVSEQVEITNQNFYIQNTSLMSQLLEESKLSNASSNLRQYGNRQIQGPQNQVHLMRKISHKLKIYPFRYQKHISSLHRRHKFTTANHNKLRGRQGKQEKNQDNQILPPSLYNKNDRNQQMESLQRLISKSSMISRNSMVSRFSLKTTGGFCVSSIEELFQDDPDIMQQVLQQYNSYLVDVAVDATSVHWYGHSTQEVMQVMYLQHYPTFASKMQQLVKIAPNFENYIILYEKSLLDYFEQTVNEAFSESVRDLQRAKFNNTRGQYQKLLEEKIRVFSFILREHLDYIESSKLLNLATLHKISKINQQKLSKFINNCQNLWREKWNHNKNGGQDTLEVSENEKNLKIVERMNELDSILEHYNEKVCKISRRASQNIQEIQERFYAISKMNQESQYPLDQEKIEAITFLGQHQQVGQF